MRLIAITLQLCLCAVLMAAPNASSAQVPSDLKGVGIDQRLGEYLPLDTKFLNENGDQVSLGNYFDGKPVVFALVYYRCPMLCSRILSGVVAGLRPLNLKAGRDFEVVAVSINPRETPDEAASKRKLYAKQYGGSETSPGWHFLVGSKESISAVTEAAGFHYRWDSNTQMYLHASAIMVATPEGALSRYFYGVEYQPKDLKLGLIESSHETIGSPVDQVLLYCYHYDPSTGKYGLMVMNLLRIAASMLLVALATGFFLLWRRERQHGQLAR